MKKVLVSIVKKSGEKCAEIPVEVRSWPYRFHQPEMPVALRERMKERDKK